MYTDAADYGEYKFGRRATGLIMAASLFALKLGLTLGGAIIGWALNIFKFVPNVAQTDESIKGILILISILPAFFGLLGGALMLFYPLSNTKMIEIEKELGARRK
jgi:GPH family glycoside/pentoside/hexuronide:cation symporter